jgi:hypothetical protein
MSSETISADLALDLETELEDLTADVLALKVHEESLRMLFSHSAGTWLNLQSLLDSSSAISQHLHHLEAQADGMVQITWLPHPQTTSDYCLVLFYLDVLNWTNLSLYHQKRLS